MKSLFLLFTGMVMGIADLVPGVSGGTVAFIFGIYEELIQSITQPVKHYCFLLKVLSGIVLSLLLFSPFIKTLLGDPFTQKLLFASFFGFVLASCFYCGKRVQTWKQWYLILFAIGAVIAFFLSHQTHVAKDNASFVYVFISGMAAVFAMLLPGISGSYLLVILGMYSTVIDALVNFFSHFDLSSIKLLATLASGVVVGAVVFSRLIRYLLEKYHDATIVLLIGFMVGALRAIYPFYEVTAPQGALILAISLLSFFIVWGIEWYASYSKNSS